MASKSIKEMKELSVAELKNKARELEKGLFDARMKKAIGQLENLASIWQMRKNLARVKFLVSSKSANAK